MVSLDERSVITPVRYWLMAGWEVKIRTRAMVDDPVRKTRIFGPMSLAPLHQLEAWVFTPSMAFDGGNETLACELAVATAPGRRDRFSRQTSAASLQSPAHGEVPVWQVPAAPQVSTPLQYRPSSHSAFVSQPQTCVRGTPAESTPQVPLCGRSGRTR